MRPSPWRWSCQGRSLGADGSCASRSSGSRRRPSSAGSHSARAFDLAYLDKALEAALIGLLLIESWLVDGGPVAVARRAGRMAVAALR
jgi:hypothetical protein